MLIDTDLKTVTFKDGETLSLDNLWTLIEILDEPLEIEPEPYRPRLMQYVDSDSNIVQYLVVQLRDGSWICSCPDFTLRHKDDSGDMCKHIRRVVWGWV